MKSCSLPTGMSTDNLVKERFCKCVFVGWPLLGSSANFAVRGRFMLCISSYLAERFLKC